MHLSEREKELAAIEAELCNTLRDSLEAVKRGEPLDAGKIKRLEERRVEASKLPSEYPCCYCNKAIDPENTEHLIKHVMFVQKVIIDSDKRAASTIDILPFTGSASREAVCMKCEKRFKVTERLGLT